jgi:hypothetical protein
MGRTMTKTKLTRAEFNANWIEQYFRVPAVPCKGGHASQRG